MLWCQIVSSNLGRKPCYIITNKANGKLRSWLVTLEVVDFCHWWADYIFLFFFKKNIEFKSKDLFCFGTMHKYIGSEKNCETSGQTNLQTWFSLQVRQIPSYKFLCYLLVALSSAHRGDGGDLSRKNKVWLASRIAISLRCTRPSYSNLFRYEPEIEPGITLKINANSSASLRLFATGKTVLIGGLS